ERYGIDAQRRGQADLAPWAGLTGLGQQVLPTAVEGAVDAVGPGIDLRPGRTAGMELGGLGDEEVGIGCDRTARVRIAGDAGARDGRAVGGLDFVQRRVDAVYRTRKPVVAEFGSDGLDAVLGALKQAGAGGVEDIFGHHP